MNEKGVAEIMRALPSEISRGCELIETHVSWIILRGSDVFKLKKPVRLGFLDFSDVDKRHAACVAEVELNRRLASSVYYGVVRITRPAGQTHQIGGDGPAVDWAVHMRRLDVSDRSDVRLEQGRLTREQVEAIAIRLATFHQTLGPSPLGPIFGGANCIRQNIEDNFEQIKELLPLYLDKEASDELLAWQRSFVSEHESDLEARVVQGRVREGHGDLRLEHIYLRGDGGMDVLDCVEFSQRFRVADVCADVVFLAMDLTHKGRTDLAEALLATYATESNDFDIYSIAAFYESYRAFVRGKVSAMIAASNERSMHARERAKADARRHFLLALTSRRSGLLPPQLIAVGGIMASGKTTVATRIAREMSAPILSADRTRKCLAGVSAQEQVHDAAFEGMYSTGFTERTYNELLRRAEVVLRSGRAVVVDASFRPRWSRTLARDLADSLGVPFTFVECKVDHNVCLDRLARRPREQAVSDSRAAIYQDFVDRWEPIIELSPAQHLQIDTTIPLGHNMSTLRGQIAMWPPGLNS